MDSSLNFNLESLWTEASSFYSATKIGQQRAMSPSAPCLCFLLMSAGAVNVWMLLYNLTTLETNSTLWLNLFSRCRWVVVLRDVSNMSSVMSWLPPTNLPTVRTGGLRIQSPSLYTPNSFTRRLSRKTSSWWTSAAHTLLWDLLHLRTEDAAEGGENPSAHAGAQLPAIEDIYRKRVLRRASTIFRDSCRPAHQLFALLQSRRRYRSLWAKPAGCAGRGWPSSGSCSCLLTPAAHSWQSTHPPAQLKRPASSQPPCRVVFELHVFSYRFLRSRLLQQETFVTWFLGSGFWLCLCFLPGLSLLNPINPFLGKAIVMVCIVLTSASLAAGWVTGFFCFVLALNDTI